MSHLADKSLGAYAKPGRQWGWGLAGGARGAAGTMPRPPPPPRGSRFPAPPPPGRSGSERARRPRAGKPSVARVQTRDARPGRRALAGSAEPKRFVGTAASSAAQSTPVTCSQPFLKWPEPTLCLPRGSTRALTQFPGRSDPAGNPPRGTTPRPTGQVSCNVH